MAAFAKLAFNAGEFGDGDEIFSILRYYSLALFHLIKNCIVFGLEEKKCCRHMFLPSPIMMIAGEKGGLRRVLSKYDAENMECVQD